MKTKEENLKCTKCGYEDNISSWHERQQYDSEGHYPPSIQGVSPEYTLCPECGSFLHVDYDLDEVGEGE